MKNFGAMIVPLLSILPKIVNALDNGVGLTPAMGYNTWDDFRCGGINASNLYKVADAMVANGSCVDFRYLDVLVYVFGFEGTFTIMHRNYC